MAKILSQDVPERLRLYVLNMLERSEGRLDEAMRVRQQRQAFLAQITQFQEQGIIALCTWSRDCDMCESTHRTLITADPRTIDAAIERDLSNAEGPLRHWLQKPSAPFEHSFRDRALEAYEDGHPHVIYED